MINPDYERRASQHESDLKEIHDALKNIDHQTRSMDGTVLAQKTRLDRIEWDLRGVREEMIAVRGDIAQILALLQPPTD